jgi:hypothetical protein
VLRDKLIKQQFSDFGKGEAFNVHWSELLGDSVFSSMCPVVMPDRQILFWLTTTKRTGLNGADIENYFVLK